jgi:hypothetical protein
MVSPEPIAKKGDVKMRKSLKSLSKFGSYGFFTAFTPLLRGDYETLVWKLSRFTQSLDPLKYAFQRNDPGDIVELESFLVSQIYDS